MRFRAYNPKTDKGRRLYEMKASEQDGKVATGVEPSEVSHEVAATIPWYFLVEDSESGQPGER